MARAISDGPSGLSWKLRAWDPVEHLESGEDMAAYQEAVLEELVVPEERLPREVGVEPPNRGGRTHCGLAEALRIGRFRCW